MARRRRTAALPALLALGLLVACGGDSAAPSGPEGGTDPEPGPDGSGNEAPGATISSPSQDAVYAPGESISFEGTADDPEDGTLSGDALVWESDLDGELGTGAAVSRNDLSEGGHAITLTATDGDGATGTDQVQIEVEGGGGSPTGDLLPLEKGRMWRYTETSETTVCGGSTGCDTDTFVGRHFVQVEGQVDFEGRFGWRLRTYSVKDDASGGEYAFDATVTHLSRDGEGLSQWVPGPDEWRRVLSTSASSIQNGTFLLVDGPPRDPDGRLTFESSSASVPFGSFSTVRVGHEYRETGEHAPEDIFDSASEHYADEVGLVAGSWDYSFDDNDPLGTDVLTAGSIELTHMDTGPLPEMITEAEPNDDHASATVLSSFSIGRGEIQAGDAGAIIDDAEVGCTQQVCVHPDPSGDKVIQDWFRLEVSQATDVRIALDFPLFNETAIANDLDLYLFRDDGSGGIVYLVRAAGPGGEREEIIGTIDPGTYYIGIQAYSTTGRIPLWLAVL